MDSCRSLERARSLPALILRLSAFVLLTASCGGDGGTNRTPNPTPTVSTLSPEGVMQGDAAFTLTVNGAGFVRGAVVRWNGSDRPTTFVAANQVTAAIAAADVEQVGTAQVRVFNPAPGGGESNEVALPVQIKPNPVPTVASVAPTSLGVEVGGVVAVAGTGFVPTSRVSVGGFEPPVTFVSATQLQFTLAPANVPTAGPAFVRVINPAPGGGSSDSLALVLTNPPPTLATASPSQAPREQDSVVVRLTGTGFVGATVVRLNGFNRITRRISPTQLDVVLTASDLVVFGAYELRAFNPLPGGGSSNALTLDPVNPAPTVSSVSPAQADAASMDSLVVRVTGTGFVTGTVVRLNGSPRVTRRISTTQVDAVLTAADLDLPGTFAITAFNGQPGGGVSGAATLTLTAPVPVITTLPSSGASAGRAGFRLMVHGTGFLPTSVVHWNGQARATTYIGPTRLEIGVTNGDLSAPGTASVSVQTPGGGTSAPAQIAIRSVQPMALSSSFSVPVAAQDIVYDPGTDRIYAALGFAAGAQANWVVAINPHTGAITDSVLVGSNPNVLALSDDGSTLWVALESSGQVRRLDLPGLTLGPAFSLGTNRVEEMRVMPGTSRTLAIALRNTCCSPSHEGVAIYDNGVRRPRSTPGHIGNNTIVFGESAAVLYGQSTEGGGFATLRVSGEGVVSERTTGITPAGYHIYYAAGRVYSSSGPVIDAARHEVVGSLSGVGNGIAVDAVLGRVYVADDYLDRLRVLDINNFQVLGEVAINFDYAGRLVHWGTNGLAIMDSNRIFITRTPTAGP